jgi:HrpA-like RNA helicase
VSKTWTVKCKDCGKPVRYSDATRTAAIERGQSAPERCADCRAQHKRQTSRLGASYVDIEPGRPVPDSGLKAGRLGRIVREARPHQAKTNKAKPIADDEFGIKDEHIRDLLTKLETHRVAVVEAGTGSGKSTFLPWRLLVPPEPFERDHLTRHGQIVVTQPRIDASSDIPEYVARRLHASVAGPGMNIGYRNSKAQDKADAANKLVYLTDGTLINMIRRGDLHTISMVVIDEAHERSLNIDLILALLRREMRTLPHLRLLIVSATLKIETFTEFFAPDYAVAHCQMPSKTSFPVYERFRAEEEIPITAWARRMPEEVATRAHQILRWIALDQRPSDIPDEIPPYDGDLLCFLPGKRHINDAIRLLQAKLDDDDEMQDYIDDIEILPLYSELPQQKRKRPLKPETRAKHVRWRVVVSTNLAETSLTIEGIRHVVDSGLNNLTSWDPQTARADMSPLPHSRAGLLQRRGRAGRIAPGIWHCLFTKAQFDSLAYETRPEIARSPLAAVVLNAAAAGVSSPESLRWLAPGPSPIEIARAKAELLAIGALTVAGDATAFGRELSASRGDYVDSMLLINADGAGCAVEIATVLAAKALRTSVLRWDKNWPPAAKLHVDAVHEALLSGSVDDVEAICRVVSFWEQQSVGDRARWSDRHYVKSDVVPALVKARGVLLAGLQSKTKTDQLRGVDLRLLPRVRAVLAWSAPNGVYETSSDASGSLTLTPISTPRSDDAIVSQMREGTPAIVGPRSRAHRAAPRHLMLLDQSRELKWMSPLADPVVVHQADICGAVDPTVLRSEGTLLGTLLGIPNGADVARPAFLPGDRFKARIRGGEVTLQSQVASLADPTVELGPSDESGLDGADDQSLDERERELEEILAPGETASDEPFEWEEAEALAQVGNEAADAPSELPPARLEGLAPDGELTVRVVSAAGGEIVVTADRTADEFAHFRSAHPEGTDLDVVLEHVHTFPHDRQPLLAVRDPTTAQQLVIDGAQLGTGLRYSQTRQLQPGQHLSVTVEGYDEDRLLTYIGQSRQVIGTLSSLGGQGRPAVVVQADVVDADEGALWVQLSTTPTEHNGRPPIVLKLDAGRLPALPAELLLGKQIQVRLAWARKSTAFTNVGYLDLNWRAISLGPWELQGDRINMTTVPTASDWDRLTREVGARIDPVSSARFRRDFMFAVKRMLMPRVSVIDREAILAMAQTGRATAVVTESNDRGVEVRLPTGDTQFVTSRFLSWDESRPDLALGDKIETFVTQADPQTGDVHIEIRDPAADPLLRLKIGSWHTGTVDRAVNGGLIVALSDAPLSGFLANRAAAGAALGATVNVRVVSIDLEKRQFELSCFAFDETLAIPETMTPIWQSSEGRIDSWGLRRALGGADLELDVRTKPSPSVRLYGNDELAGIRGISMLRGLFSGAIGFVQVPELKTFNADDFRLARSFAYEAALVGRRIPSGGKQMSVIVVAARDWTAISDIAYRIKQAYPKRWVTELFRRQTANWRAGEAAAKEAAPNVWITSDRVDASYGPPFFRVTLTGDPAEVRVAWEAIARYVQIPGGAWQEDDRIRLLT